MHHHPSEYPGIRPTYAVRDGFATLGISATTGYELIRKGKLKTYTVGRSRYVSGEEIVRFIRDRETAATA